MDIPIFLLALDFLYEALTSSAIANELGLCSFVGDVKAPTAPSLIVPISTTSSAPIAPTGMANRYGHRDSLLMAVGIALGGLVLWLAKEVKIASDTS